MSADLYFIVFVVMAVAINVVIYVGVTLAYFSEKRRAEAARVSVETAPSIARSDEGMSDAVRRAAENDVRAAVHTRSVV